MLLFDLKIYENSCKTHITVLSYFVRLILSGNLCTVLELVEKELPTLPEHMGSPAVFSGIRVLFVMFCRSLFVLYSFFFWPLCCLSFFNLHILITTLVSSDTPEYTVSSCLSYLSYEFCIDHDGTTVANSVVCIVQ